MVRVPEGELFAKVARDTWRCLPDLLLFFFLFKSIQGLVLVPATAWVFRQLVASSGNHAIGNLDIATFLLTPRGLVALLLAGLSILALEFLNCSGLLCIGYAATWDRRASWLDALSLVGRRALKILEASFLGLLAVVAAVTPFLALGGIVYRLLLFSYDINYYLSVRPPEYRVVLVTGVILITLASIAAVFAYLAIVFALPSVLFHGDRVPSAFARSISLVRREWRRIAGPLVGWLFAWWLASTLIHAIGWQVGRVMVAAAGQRVGLLIAVLGLLFVLNVITSQVLAFLLSAVNLLLIAHLFREVSRRASTELPPPEAEALLGDRPSWSVSGWLRLAGAAAVLVGIAAVGYGLLREGELQDRVEITAHRGSSMVAPENTLAAIEQAVVDGADFVEIDVQLTADGVIVVKHDADLMRIAARPRVVTQSTFAELRELDIGSWFAPEFADERLPTLVEAIETVRDRARLDVEIKSYAADGDQLVAGVVETLRAHEMIGQSVIMSLKYDELRQVRRLAPEIPVGYLATASIGRLADLDVDFLAVTASTARDTLIVAAHAQDKQVWVWTVNDRTEMSRLIDRGVDNLITDTPATMVDVLAGRAELDTVERILLRFQSLYID